MSTALKKMKMPNISSEMLRQKFKGSLLGSLLGDCLGSPYEGDIITPGDRIIIQRYFDKLETPDFKGPMRCYTDDTAMMKSIAQSLVENPEINFVHIAKLFVKEYFLEPNRGYGENVVEVFNKLRKNKFVDIYKPASEQFSGSGSYGNGGAMRIAPIALYYYNNYDAMIDSCKKSSQITHTNPLGVYGAVMQCVAIHQALLTDPKKTIDKNQFCDELINKIGVLEKENDDGLELEDCNPYQVKLKRVRKYLNTKYHDELDEEIIQELGNSISAYDSVPTAIYCFLRALDEIPGIQTDNIYRRTIQYAITLGGDTDTIACMAGAIAGAFVGAEQINPNLIKQCEYHKEIIDLAEGLHNCVVK